MNKRTILAAIQDVLDHMPTGWLDLTTHRLDIYNEQLAKTEFLEQFEHWLTDSGRDPAALQDLPTAYDYIRLGHPLSCLLEWAIGKLNGLPADHVISFSSRSMPILAILRKNALEHVDTRIVYTGALPSFLDADALQGVYNYSFELLQIQPGEKMPPFTGQTILLAQDDEIGQYAFTSDLDFYVSLHAPLGSVVLVSEDCDSGYVSEIQHVRRRESIAMTPANCFTALTTLLEGVSVHQENQRAIEVNRAHVRSTIQSITGTTGKALVGSSGLSIQYAIMMGLIDYAQENHPGRDIKFLVPPNCYGGTNDQARRVAASISHVEIVDLPVDRDNDMARSVDRVLDLVAAEDAVPYIIAEIPTNPRVEVPDLNELKAALTRERKTPGGEVAIDPVFILDQTFCPNVQFLEGGAVLSDVRAISYASGSKFPSGGMCTAGYCVGNTQSKVLMEKVDQHLQLCDNEATALQLEILAKQLPSMNKRIQAAYQNTREFVHFIKKNLPSAKINFVSDELAQNGFTPSVFSLDLPTKGDTEEEREAYKRALNHKLIQLMINEIPEESKYCVSYGQLKGCYWTIPATSTQGTTKEGDKDYIARVALSPKINLDRHKEVFLDFIEENELAELRRN